MVTTGSQQYSFGSCACGGRSPAFPYVDSAEPDHHYLWAFRLDRRLNGLCHLIELRTHVVPQVGEVLNLADLDPRIIEGHPSDNRTAVFCTDDYTQ